MKNRMKLIIRIIQRFFITLAVKMFAFPVNHPKFKRLSVGCAIVLSKLEESLLREIQAEARVCMDIADKWQMEAKKRLFLSYKLQNVLEHKDEGKGSKQ